MTETITPHHAESPRRPAYQQYLFLLMALYALTACGPHQTAKKAAAINQALEGRAVATREAQVIAAVAALPSHTFPSSATPFPLGATTPEQLQDFCRQLGDCVNQAGFTRGELNKPPPTQFLPLVPTSECAPDNMLFSIYPPGAALTQLNHQTYPEEMTGILWGIDVAAGRYAPVRAPFSGTVVTSNISRAKNTIIWLENKYYLAILLHGQSLTQSDSQVCAGQILAHESDISSKNTTGNHTHWVIIRRKTPNDNWREEYDFEPLGEINILQALVLDDWLPVDELTEPLPLTFYYVDPDNGQVTKGAQPKQSFSHRYQPRIRLPQARRQPSYPHTPPPLLPPR